ncbi:hypothetical protein FB45DRAFT_1034196 [Roridomyces roridus]|uniref:Protein kinase domain-containing protein n=1 Tax=Roridomyces roridus TaxID=1738132 RepID=A0AAD7BDT0_9AGAR|nr:hypothetical protein FB45DRAFT_1034196 [Roridomyces roridus]
MHGVRELQPNIPGREKRSWISDGAPVLVKSVSSSVHPEEVRIACLLTSPPHVGRPRNHSIPIWDVLNDPLLDADKQRIVMPLCVRITRPVFDTVGEVVDCIRQIFEGIEYMHEHFIAHRDCNWLNVVQDATGLYPEGFHPVSPFYDREYKLRAHVLTRR